MLCLFVQDLLHAIRASMPIDARDIGLAELACIASMAGVADRDIPVPLFGAWCLKLAVPCLGLIAACSLLRVVS